MNIYAQLSLLQNAVKAPKEDKSGTQTLFAFSTVGAYHSDSEWEGF